MLRNCTVAWMIKSTPFYQPDIWVYFREVHIRKPDRTICPKNGHPRLRPFLLSHPEQGVVPAHLGRTPKVTNAGTAWNGGTTGGIASSSKWSNRHLHLSFFWSFLSSSEYCSSFTYFHVCAHHAIINCSVGQTRQIVWRLWRLSTIFDTMWTPFLVRGPSVPVQTCKVAYLISHLMGRAETWATAEWARRSAISDSYAHYSPAFSQIFLTLSPGREAARSLISLRQRYQSVMDYAVQFCTLAADSSWNNSALTDD